MSAKLTAPSLKWILGLALLLSACGGGEMRPSSLKSASEKDDQINIVTGTVEATQCPSQNYICEFEVEPLRSQNKTVFTWAVRHHQSTNLNFQIRLYGYDDHVYYVVCYDFVCGAGSEFTYLDYDNSDFNNMTYIADPEVKIYQFTANGLYEGALEIRAFQGSPQEMSFVSPWVAEYGDAFD